MCKVKDKVQESDSWHYIRGSWDIFIGGLQKKYGQLTKEGLMEARGSYKQLVGVIEKEYKVSKKQAQAIIAEIYGQD